jgi:hypothetical protein
MARQVIINRVLRELERIGQEPVTADKIATGLKLPPRDVRIALQNYVHNHPEGCVTRVATGIFRWNCDAPTGSTAPETPKEIMSAGWVAPAMMDIPAMSVNRGGVTFEDVDQDPGLKLLHKAPGSGDDEPSYFFTDRQGAVWRAYRV